MMHPFSRMSSLLAGLACASLLSACGTQLLAPVTAPPEGISYSFPAPAGWPQRPAQSTTQRTTPDPQPTTSKPEDQPAAGFPAFSLQAEATRLTLINGSTQVTLSRAFMDTLASLVSDHVLNQDEFTRLSQNADSSEQTFISILQRSPWITMPNLVSSATDAATLSFMTAPTLNLGGAFLQRVHALGSDGVLDHSEIQGLNAAADEKIWLSGKLVSDQSSDMLLLNQAGEVVTLTLRTWYDEAQTLPGDSPAAWVGQLGQTDRLSQTSTDSYRCIAGAILNYVLLSEGRSGFERLAGSLGSPATALSFENLHLLQDTLYRQSGAGTGGMSFSADRLSGQIIGGTAVTAIHLAGVTLAPNLLARAAGSYQTPVRRFFDSQPAGALIATVNLDTRTGAISFSGNISHAVLVTHSNGVYYVSDTGQRNGTGLNHRPMTAAEQSQWFLTTNPVLQLLPRR
ncbi:MAG: hypothetical protein ACAI44_36510 [Candidatus Sericytochromatia bacterium]